MFEVRIEVIEGFVSEENNEERLSYSAGGGQTGGINRPRGFFTQENTWVAHWLNEVYRIGVEAGRKQRDQELRDILPEY